MIGKTSRGAGFRGVLNYVFGPGKHDKSDRAVLLGGSMAGWEPRGLAREFGELRALRTDCKNPVKHLSFSVPAGEHLTDDQWLQVAAGKATQEGWDTWCLVRHDDEPHDHVHMVASRITQDGQLIREEGFDVQKTEQICREFEIRFGLEQVQSPKRSAAGKKIPTERDHVKGPTTNERRTMERTQERSIRVNLQVEIQVVMASTPASWDEFREALGERGILLHATQKGGKITGLTYEMNGERMKGSDLGKSFAAKQITEQLEQNQEVVHAAARTLVGVRGPRAVPTIEADGPSIRRTRDELQTRRAQLERTGLEGVEPGGGQNLGLGDDLASVVPDPTGNLEQRDIRRSETATGTRRGPLGAESVAGDTGHDMAELATPGTVEPGCGPCGHTGTPDHPGRHDAGGEVQLESVRGGAPGNPADGGPVHLDPGCSGESCQTGEQLLDGEPALARGGPGEPLGRRLLGYGGGSGPDRTGEPAGIAQGLEGVSGGLVSRVPTQSDAEFIDPAGAPAGTGCDPAPGGHRYVPRLPRVTHVCPQLPMEIEPDELPDLVQAWARVACDWTYGKETSEVDVRDAYALPEISWDVLESMSWADRARNLVMDGWAKLRTIFRQTPKPEPLHVPEPEVQPLLDDSMWDDLEVLGHQAAAELAKDFEQFRTPAVVKPPREMTHAEKVTPLDRKPTKGR